MRDPCLFGRLGETRLMRVDCLGGPYQRFLDLLSHWAADRTRRPIRVLRSLCLCPPSRGRLSTQSFVVRLAYTFDRSAKIYI